MGGKQFLIIRVEAAGWLPHYGSDCFLVHFRMMLWFCGLVGLVLLGVMCSLTLVFVFMCRSGCVGATATLGQLGLGARLCLVHNCRRRSIAGLLTGNACDSTIVQIGSVLVILTKTSSP